MTNRKKVRGWPRRIKDVHRWCEWQAKRDLVAQLDHDQRVHAKIWIHPWYRIVRRAPPPWLQRLIIEGLFRIHDAWKAKLEAARPDATLAVWLAHPRFMESRVVALAGDWIGYTAGLVVPAPPTQRIPMEAKASSGFDWVCHADDDDFDEDDWQDAPDDPEIARVRARAWRSLVDPGESLTLCVRTGDLWIGTQRRE